MVINKQLVQMVNVQNCNIHCALVFTTNSQSASHSPEGRSVKKTWPQIAIIPFFLVLSGARLWDARGVILSLSVNVQDSSKNSWNIWLLMLRELNYFFLSPLYYLLKIPVSFFFFFSFVFSLYIISHCISSLTDCRLIRMILLGLVAGGTYQWKLYW